MKALVIGATGALGRDLVSELLQHDCWEEIYIFVRRSCGLRDSRIKEHIIDFHRFRKPEGMGRFGKGRCPVFCAGNIQKASGQQGCAMACGL